MSKYEYQSLKTGDDLNAKLGHYRIEQNSVVESLLNCPVNNGEITVDWYPAINSGRYGMQVLRRSLKGTSSIYIRSKIDTSEFGEWICIATKSDLDLKLNNTSIFVGNGKDFGQAIKEAGIVKLNRVGFFICNNPSNSPLGNGLIILAHNVGYWNNHPMYIQINGSSISCGTLNCSDYTHITKD